MSVAVGVRAKDGVWLAADSYMSNLLEGQCVAGKAFMVGPVGFAVVGNFRHGQAVEHHLELPAAVPGESTIRWCVRRLIPSLKEITDDHDLLSEDERGLDMLVAVRGELFTLQSDWAVFQSMEGYAAVGTGSTVALGSLHSTSRWGPRRRAEAAASAACHHVPNVSKPVHLLWVPA